MFRHERGERKLWLERTASLHDMHLAPGPSTYTYCLYLLASKGKRLAMVTIPCVLNQWHYGMYAPKAKAEPH
jgi:hypothetical protein